MLNYFTIKEILINNTNENEGYVCLSLILAALSINLLFIAILIFYTTDGHEIYLIKSTLRTFI